MGTVQNKWPPIILQLIGFSEASRTEIQLQVRVSRVDPWTFLSVAFREKTVEFEESYCESSEVKGFKVMQSGGRARTIKWIKSNSECIF